MKKLLLILLCLPMIGFGQLAEAKEYFDKAFNESESISYRIENYTKAIKIDSDYRWAYWNRASDYMEIGNYKDAIDDYTNCLRLSDLDWSYINRGFAYYKLGEYGKALADFNTYISKSANDASGYFERGRVYATLGKYQLALDDMDRSINIKDDNGMAYYIRAACKLELGLNGCNDIKRACDLKAEAEDACEKYNNLCK